jgi:hypothetical protein
VFGLEPVEPVTSEKPMEAVDSGLKFLLSGDVLFSETAVVDVESESDTEQWPVDANPQTNGSSALLNETETISPEEPSGETSAQQTSVSLSDSDEEARRDSTSSQQLETPGQV